MSVLNKGCMAAIAFFAASSIAFAQARLPTAKVAPRRSDPTKHLSRPEQCRGHLPAGDRFRNEGADSKTGTPRSSRRPQLRNATRANKLSAS